MKKLSEGIDFYYDGDDNMVLTTRYHEDRGYCCGLGCRHCPYAYENVPEPRRTLLLKEYKNEVKKPSSTSKDR
jgi:hypothetical protein